MRNYLLKLGKQAKKVSFKKIRSKKKNKVLQDYCDLIFHSQLDIIRENNKDLKHARNKKLKDNVIKRLLIDKKKILQIIHSIKKIIQFRDPVDQILESWKRPNGLKISKITTSIPLAFILFIIP